MDIQLKRGLLDVCVLAAIKNEDSYGYKIIKYMKPYIVLSESTLYTILKRLEIANMLTVWAAGALAEDLLFGFGAGSSGRRKNYENEKVDLAGYSPFGGGLHPAGYGITYVRGGF